MDQKFSRHSFEPILPLQLPREKHLIGNFGIYCGYPLPGGHTQVGVGYKFLLGPQLAVIKVPVGNLVFTF